MKFRTRESTRIDDDIMFSNMSISMDKTELTAKQNIKTTRKVPLSETKIQLVYFDWPQAKVINDKDACKGVKIGVLCALHITCKYTDTVGKNIFKNGHSRE